MRKTDQEADDALVYIRQSTAVPIQRFLDSIAAARLEQDRNLRDDRTAGPPKLGLWRGAGGLGRRIKDLVSSFGKPLNAQTFVRVVHRIRQRRPRDEP
jgi:hypothetical protein